MAALAQFETPSNQRSFSALIDAAILETGQAAKIPQLVQYANLTIRECEAVGLFHQQMLELEVIATANPHIWVKPARFRRMRSAKYKTQDIFPKFLKPGIIQQNKTYLYYAVEDSFVFGGVNVGESIAIAYYSWLKPLFYYPQPTALTALKTAQLVGSDAVARPAYYDELEDLWYYWDGTDYVLTLGSTTLDEAARLVSSNWLTEDWYDLILSGIIAKVMTKRGDTTKSAPYYSQYTQAKTVLAQVAVQESSGV